MADVAIKKAAPLNGGIKRLKDGFCIMNQELFMKIGNTYKGAIFMLPATSAWCIAFANSTALLPSPCRQMVFA